MRRTNNQIKRDFLTQWVPRGATVLDVGCGQGGDIHKWRNIGLKKLVGVDPNPWAIEEARRRSHADTFASYFTGDVRDAPVGVVFDVVCYNFSLQYQPLELLPEVTKRLAPNGGLFMGVVTDSTRLDMCPEATVHRVGEEDKISVYIPGVPYYANGPVVEPILDKHEFIREAERLGLELRVWEPFSMYAKFVFVLK